MQRPNTVPTDVGAPARYAPGRSLCAAAVALAAFAPLVLQHFANLWKRPHYQFFPLLIAGVAGLIWSRREMFWRAAGTAPASRSAQVCAVMSLFGLTLAVVGSSPWLATASLLVFVAAVVLHAAGAAAFRTIAMPWALLWIALPPPLGLDQRLIGRLQRLASLAASKFSDWLGINHLLEGNVVQLPDRSLFVDEACSGVNSLISMIALVALVIVWKRRSWIHGSLLLLTVVAWTTAANLGRLVSIIVAAAWYQTDLAKGWPHDALAFAWLIPLLLLVAATDGGLLFLFSRVRTRGNPLSRWWNRWIADTWPLTSPPPDANSPPELSAPAKFDTWGPSPALLGWSGLLIVGQAALLLLPYFTRPPRLAERITAVERESLPGELGGWEVVNYRVEKRERGHIEGESSKLWELQRQNARIVVSLDYPFLAWHELTSCYLGNGWQVDHRETISLPGDGASEGRDFVEVQLSKSGGERSYLLYGLYDRAGNSWPPPRELWSLSSRLRDKVWRQFERYGIGQDTYQLQIFFPTDREISDEQKQEFRLLYASVRRMLLETGVSGGES